MATTLDTRLQLVGGQELQAQLLSIGKTGERMFATLENGASVAAPRLSRVGAASAAAAVQLAALRDGAVALGARLSAVVAPISNLAQNMGLLGGATAAGAAAGLVGLARSSATAADASAKSAEALGLNVETFSKFAFAARQGGVDADTFSTAMIAFANAAQSGDERFERLGVKIKDSSGNFRDVDDLFRDVADRLSAMPDGFQKTALATDLFGRAGARLIPVLSGGSAGLANFGQQAVALGAVVTSEQARLASKFGDSIDNLVVSVQGAVRAAVTPLLPALTQITDAVGKWIADNRGPLIDFAENAFGKVRTVVADVIKLVRGDESGIQNKWLLDLFRQGQEVAQMFSEMWSWVDRLAGAIGLTGGQLGLIVAVGSLTGAFSAFSAVLVSAVAAARLLVPLLVGPASIIAAILGWPATLALTAAAIVVFWDDIVAGANRVWNRFKQIFPSVGAEIEAGVRNGVRAASDWLVRLWVDVVNVVEAIKRNLSRAIKNALPSFLGGAPASSEAPPGYARGGQVKPRKVKTGWRVVGRGGWRSGMGWRAGRFAEGGPVFGPGTATSDSIPARLSAGEFVVRAAAVRHYGADLLDAMNRMVAPRGFAEGGMVAAGAGGGDVNLNFNGPIMAPSPETFIDDLNRYLDGGGRARIRPVALAARGRATV